MIFDSHMHSKFSTDSNMKIEDAIKISKNKNIGLIITEHMDLDYYKPNEFRCDVPAFFEEYNKFRCDTLGLGIELGLSESTLKANENIAKNFDFDFILGSIHNINGSDIYSEYCKLSKNNYPKKDYFQKYLDSMLSCVKLYNNFDSLSHIDYLCRYSYYDDNEINIEIYKDTIAEIVQTLLQKGKVMELNSSRLNNIKAQESLLKIYRLYKDLGGKYLTIGSDAHTSNDIGRNFKIALDMCEFLKLKGVYFKKRKIELF